MIKNTSNICANLYIIGAAFFPKELSFLPIWQTDHDRGDKMGLGKIAQSVAQPIYSQD
jgi:hypothetical protein